MTIATQRAVRSTTSLADDDHEQVVVRQDPDNRPAVHRRRALHRARPRARAGCGCKRYPGGLREALEDVMALARTMTLKASAAGLDLGGGKAVMIDDGRGDQREARLEAAAGVIDELDGAYITAEDIGTTTADMDHHRPLHPLRRGPLRRARRPRRSLAGHGRVGLPRAPARALAAATGQPRSSRAAGWA